MVLPPRLKVTLAHALPVLFNLSLRSAMQKLNSYTSNSLNVAP